MERIAKLEVLAEVIRSDVADVKKDVRELRDGSVRFAEGLARLGERFARLEERVSHLPTKGWGVTALVILVGLIGAIVGLAPKLQALLGTLPR